MTIYYHRYCYSISALLNAHLTHTSYPELADYLCPYLIKDKKNAYARDSLVGSGVIYFIIYYEKYRELVASILCVPVL